jgi:hypothetical protein
MPARVCREKDVTGITCVEFHGNMIHIAPA